MKTLISSILLLVSVATIADEGMWQPHQLPQIADQLRETGLELAPESLTDLTGFPMGAIVSLGGCTASFLSDKALIATNHHCVYGSVQYNSTEDNNLLANGFLAKTLQDELPATPGTRVYVTEEITPVTDAVKNGITADMSGKAHFDTIDKNKKALVAACESEDRYRCSVVTFHGGLEYYLFKQLTIRDVRLVHVPASSIGKFGGDIDNWMWPRHTGDYGFYRAYVGKDGEPADYHKDNVPYKPKHFLKVNKSSVAAGDYVMLLGYPGYTDRHRIAAEVANQFSWTYPTAKAYRESIIDLIENAGEPGSELRIKYESTRAGLANYAKNYGSMIRAYHQGDILARKQQLEGDLTAWVNANPERKAQYGDALPKLQSLIKQQNATRERDLLLAYFNRSQMWRTANQLYKLANEKTKDDADRDKGYQERDLDRFRQRLETIDRRFDAGMDQAIFEQFLARYADLPKSQRLAALDTFFGINKAFNAKKMNRQLSKMYKKTQLSDQQQRLAWMDKSVADFKASKDPFIQLAVATFDEREAIEDAEDAITGDIQAARSAHMEALLAYYKDLKRPVYADANSTLRVTFGKVEGYSPQDGLTATPFTTLSGIAAKYTGEAPFDAPQKQLDLIKNNTFGEYADAALNSVPVNFLSTLDITGGNSGSPTLNSKAEFVGLVFDKVYESIIGDWDYDTHLNRSIHVDVKYMLWVMEHVDGASNIIDEMTIVE